MVSKRILLLFIFSLIFFLSNAQSLKSCKPNQFYKKLNGPGLLVAYHYPRNRFEIGVSKIILYREKKAFTNVSIVRYKPPFLIEAALSSEIAIIPKFFIGPQLSAWISPFSFKTFNLNSFFGKVGFYSLGHILVGSNLIYYMDFNQPALNFRPEIGLYHSFRIKKLFNRSFYLFPRISYGKNFSTKAVQNYQIGKNQFTFKMTIYWKMIGK